MISLSRGGLELDVVPEMGGAVTRFAFESRNVLRPARNPADALETSCFPLVPYANRIDKGVFVFEGREHRLPLNFGAHPHSLHGHGWQTAWRVESLSKERAVLAFDHAADAWPWTYAAEQVFALEDRALTVRLSIHSRSTANMPVGLGFHPYFPRSAGSRITASVKGMWFADTTMVPTAHVKATTLVDLAHGVEVDKAPFVDYAFTGWRSPARIDQPSDGLAVSLAASPECGFLHVYMPEGEKYFCAEPVTAMPNAFNRPEPAAVTGARVLAPGETFSIGLRIGLDRL